MPCRNVPRRSELSTRDTVDPSDQLMRSYPALHAACTTFYVVVDTEFVNMQIMLDSLGGSLVTGFSGT